MNAAEFYREIYKIIGDATPIGVDCGQLCKCACCEGDDETGMYLFPGEKKLYAGDSGWFEIMKSEFCYVTHGKSIFTDLFVCKKFCDMEKRPLGCRIFPLLPYVSISGELSVILDPRGRGLCPLTVMELTDLDSDFCRRIERVGKILMKFDATREFLYALSRLADEYRF